MLNYDTSNLEKTCTELVKAFEGKLAWKWDDRFNTALAEFDVNDQKDILKIIETHMGDIWDGGNFQKAPEIIQLVIKFFGGLHPGQELYTTNPERDDLLLCAWWPWGNGQTISIRLGIFGQTLTSEENFELTLLFKDWFNL